MFVDVFDELNIGTDMSHVRMDAILYTTDDTYTLGTPGVGWKRLFLNVPAEAPSPDPHLRSLQDGPESDG